MKASFKALRWEKGTATLFPRSSIGYVPQNATLGANGTVIVTQPAKMFLTLTAEDGRIITTDIADTVRFVNGWKNFSEKRFFNLRNRLQWTQFQLDENYNVVDLGGIVQF